MNLRTAKVTGIAAIASGFITLIVFSAVSWYVIVDTDKNAMPPRQDVVVGLEMKSELKALRSELTMAKATISDLRDRLSLEEKPSATSSDTTADHNVSDQSANPTEPSFLSEVGMADSMLELNRSEISNAIELENAVTEMEASFWQDEYDFQWTVNTENQLKGVFDSETMPSTSLGTVQCHSRLCLVEFVHTDDDGHNVLLQQLANIETFSGQFLVKTDESGHELRTFVYFPRQGESLPVSVKHFTH